MRKAFIIRKDYRTGEAWERKLMRLRESEVEKVWNMRKK